MPPSPLASGLVALELRLQAVAPPRLDALIERILVAQGFNEFMDLVRQYIPEHEASIMRATGPDQRLALFAIRFRDKYFPLHWVFEQAMDDDVGYDYMVHSIHALPMGWDEDDWHDIQSRHNGHQLLFVLCRCCDDPGHDNGLRIPALEVCAEHTSRRVLRRIPDLGYTRAELHRWLDGTEYEAAAQAADWFHNSTGNGFLDYGDEMSANAYDPWDPETVAEMTLLWQQADLIHNQVEDFRTWLELNPNKNFGELLDFIDDQKESEGMEVVVRDPRQLKLIELFAPDVESDGSDV